MPLEKFDFFFPFFVFFYGILLLVVLEGGILHRHQLKGGARISEIWIQSLVSHRGLAWVCFWAGGLWSLQNLLF